MRSLAIFLLAFIGPRFFYRALFFEGRIAKLFFFDNDRDKNKKKKITPTPTPLKYLITGVHKHSGGTSRPRVRRRVYARFVTRRVCCYYFGFYFYLL